MKNRLRIISLFIFLIGSLSFHSVVLACSAHHCTQTELWGFSSCDYYGISKISVDFLDPSANFVVTCCNTKESSTDGPLGLGDTKDITPGCSWCECSYSYTGAFGLVSSSDYSNSQPTINSVSYSMGIGDEYDQSVGTTPFTNACAHITMLVNSSSDSIDGNSVALTGMNQSQLDFYQKICVLTNPPSAASPCVTNDSRLQCNVPIACAFLQRDDGWNFNNIYGCYFVEFPPSPPAFSCESAPPPQIPTMAVICVDGTIPSSTNQCVLPSSDGGDNGGTGIKNTFFTPAMRVAFNTPYTSTQSNIFVPFGYASSAICQAGSGDSNICNTPPLQTVSTITQCSGVGDTNCVIIGSDASPLSGSASFPTNLELTYNGTNGVPTRYFTGSLFGVNLGQYCDLSYDLLSLGLTVQPKCKIYDVYGNISEFELVFVPSPDVTSSDSSYFSSSKICLNNNTNNTSIQIGCASIPPMPLPSSIDACPGAGIDDLCIQLTFNAPGKSIVTQIKGSQSAIIPAGFNGLITYQGSIGNDPNSVSLSAVVTDVGYNLPLNFQVTGTTLGAGDLCLDGTGNFGGNAIATCPPAATDSVPAGLYYNNGQYVSGGTKFCYLPTVGLPVCSSECNGNCNCVLTTATVMNASAGNSTVISNLIAQRITPQPAVGVIAGNTYNGSPAPSANQAIRGFNPIEAGRCVDIIKTLPPSFIPCGNIGDAYGSGKYCKNMQGYSTLKADQVACYEYACVDYVKYCSNNPSQCEADYQQCINTPSNPPSLPSSIGLASDAVLSPSSSSGNLCPYKGVSDGSNMSVCGFYMQSNDCPNCGSYSMCCGESMDPGIVLPDTCKFYISCVNASSCTDNAP